MCPAKEYHLSSIVVEPALPAKKTIIWLHGLGADGNDFVPMAKELILPDTLNVRFVFPHAPVMPVTINDGHEMRAWYDIFSFAMDGKIDYDGIDQSIHLVKKLIEHEESHGISTKDIILGGFSQGAVIALSA